MFSNNCSKIFFIAGIISIVTGKSTEKCLGNKPKISLTPDFLPSIVSSSSSSSSSPITSAPALGSMPITFWNEDVKWYKVKSGSCTLDGLRVHSDFHVGTLLSTTGGFNEVCPKGEETAADAFIEHNDEGHLGIRVNITACLRSTSLVEDNFNGSGQFSNYSGTGIGRHLVTMVLHHSVRIEDPDGWLVEKFLFKILQSVDLQALYNENEARLGEEIDKGDDEEETVTRNNNTVVGTESTFQTLKWGCKPHDPLVSMDPGFAPINIFTIPTSPSPSNSICTPEGICRNPPITCPNSSCCLHSNNNSVSNNYNPILSCGCHDNATGTCLKTSNSLLEAEWGGCCQNGMVVNTTVLMNSRRDQQCNEDSTAQILLNRVNQEWILSIHISECINLKNSSAQSAGPQSSSSLPQNKVGPVHFKATINISEEGTYQRK